MEMCFVLAHLFPSLGNLLSPAELWLWLLSTYLLTPRCVVSLFSPPLTPPPGLHVRGITTEPPANGADTLHPVSRSSPRQLRRVGHQYNLFLTPRNLRAETFGLTWPLERVWATACLKTRPCSPFSLVNWWESMEFHQPGQPLTTCFFFSLNQSILSLSQKANDKKTPNC